jgi:DNA-binding MarR family transcriptional regulator
MTFNRGEAISGVFDNLRRVIQVVYGYSNRAKRIGGLTGPQLWAIRLLSGSKPVRVTDLARRMYLHPSTVVGILDRLEHKGLAVRERSKEDHRVVEVRLTPKGDATIAKAPPVVQGLLLEGLEGLSESELGVVSEGLELLVGILGAQRMPPQLLFSPEVNLPNGGDSERAGGEPEPPPVTSKDRP